MNSIPALKHDIQSPTDIRLLVDSFYGKARQDELLAPIFDHAITDWEHHLPTMYQFWERLLLGSTDYNGNPFSKHLNLSLDSEHFVRWLELFNQTLDENFSGTKTEETKRLASNIAGSFQLRMGITPTNNNYETINYSRV
ncbi:MAG: hemoglobin [Nitrospinales bacterium]|jgi:hemoglobin